MTTKLSEYLAALHDPDRENLTTHFILEEIIEHIDVFRTEFPHVKIDILKTHLWKIRNKDVGDPSTHLRGFLQVFQDTDVFKDAFDELDEGMKRQLKVFMKNGTAEHILHAGTQHDGAFALPASPPVKHHFQDLMKKVETMFHREEKTNGSLRGDALNGTSGLNHAPEHSEETNGLHKLDALNGTNGVDRTPEHLEEANGLHKVDTLNGTNGVDHTPEHLEEANGLHKVDTLNGTDKVDQAPEHLNEANGLHKVDTLNGTNGTSHTPEHSKKGNGVLNGTNEDAAIPTKSPTQTETPNGTDVVQDVSVKHLTKVTPHDDVPKIYEDAAQTKTMEVYGDREFQNWGQSVSNTPLWTFVPKTVLGLQNLVKWAKIHDYRIRCAGYRHSWSSTFSQDKQILVSLLNLEEVNKLPDPMSIEPEYIDPNNELKTITLAAPPGVTASSTDKALVRVGVSVTNEQFRRWAVKNDKWTMPVDVILVEVTWGGVNGPICHGAGRAHQTVNDYVRAVEYVDANGVHRTVSDPEHLKAAAGHFGLLGIVTHITFELDKMRYAVMKPVKPDIGLAIPPLHRKDIPIALRKTYSQAQYDAAVADFENRAENDYYSEWFWFTRSQQAWVNTWNSVDDREGVQDYPSPIQTWFQWVEGWLGAVITGNPIFQAMPGRWQATILSEFGMIALPPFEFIDQHQEKTETIKTALPNALHFRRGIQNMRVRDLEFQIPIPALASDPNKPDYQIVRKAWWDIINLCYADDACPMRLTMELRIMGDSKLLMAPQHGNTHGTASIEVLSIPDVVSDHEWEPFLQKVADLWLSYADADGQPLNVRPHWAKEWERIQMRGKPAREYLKTVAYRDQIPQFRAALRSIGKGQGWELGDIQKRFSNELWDDLIYS